MKVEITQEKSIHFILCRRSGYSVGGFMTELMDSDLEIKILTDDDKDDRNILSKLDKRKEIINQLNSVVWSKNINKKNYITR